MTKTRQWTTITAVVVLVILAGGYLLLVKSQKSKVADLQTQTSAQLGQNQLLLTQIAQLQALQSQLPAEQQALAKFSTQIPDNAAEPTLLRQFSRTAHNSGVDMSSFAPGTGAPVSASATAQGQTLGAAPSTTLTLYSLPLSLQLSGSYANVESFFQSLEKLSRAVIVQTFSISGNSAAAATGSPDQVSVTMTAQVFYTPQVTPPTTTGQAQTLGSTQPSAPTTAPTTATTPSPGDTPSTGSTPAAAT